jgi:hypothetical protein
MRLTGQLMQRLVVFGEEPGCPDVIDKMIGAPFDWTGGIGAHRDHQNSGLRRHIHADGNGVPTVLICLWKNGLSGVC